MYTDEDNSSDLIGAFCELLFPRRGRRNGIIVDDYGNEWLVQLDNGRLPISSYFKFFYHVVEIYF